MRQHAQRRLTLVLGVALAVAAPGASATWGDSEPLVVTQITIDAGETWKPPAERSRVQILREGDHFRRGNEEVSTQAVARLIESVAAAPIPRPSLLTLDISRDELIRGAAEYCRDKQKRTGDPKTDDLLFQRCTSGLEDWSAFERGVEDYFDASWTDDYAQLNVAIEIHNGKVLHLRSKAQHQLMLPWSIERPEGETITFDRRISDAIADLLPEDFVHLARVRGELLVRHVLRRVHWELRSDLARVEADSLFGHWLDGIRPHYQIVESNLAILTRVDIGYRDHPDSRWHGKLRHSRMPSNLVFDVSIVRNAAPNASEFSRALETYLRLVSEVGWLWRAIEEHPEMRFKIRYVDGRSLSDTGENYLRRALQEVDSDRLNRLSPRDIASGVYFEATLPGSSNSDCGGSRWLVLRTGDTLLWSFSGNDPLRTRFLPLTLADCGRLPAAVMIDSMGHIAP